MATELATLPRESELDEVRMRARSLRSLLDPEWRYTRAKFLKTSGTRYFRRTEDAWVITLAKFLARWSDASVDTVEQVETDFPDVAWAYHIYVNELKGPRYHLEALVITQMPTDEIADFLGLPTLVVNAYERLFFDIRQHLDKPGAIRMYVSARAKAHGLLGLHPDPLWKLLALDEGVSMLMALWSDGVLDEADLRRCDELIASQARRNALAAMQVRTVNSNNANDIINEYILLFKNESERKKLEAEISGPGDKVSEIVGSLMSAVSFSVAAVGQGSEKAFMELTTAVSYAPKLLERLQGAAGESKNVGSKKTGE